MKHRCFASCSFGLESIVAAELRNLGLKDVKAYDARVYFSADENGLARANICLRTADRVYIELKTFTAKTFDELFEGVKSAELESYIPPDAEFPVNADSVKSALFSVSDIQSISKKAAADRLMQKHKTKILAENGERYDIHIKILRDEVSVCLNVSGAGLNRRGYRTANVKAPIRETLAAGLVMLTGWKSGEFSDPMCGSGTIAIEAAMISANIAPGLHRSFDGEKWRMFSGEWAKERAATKANEREQATVYASDIDTKALGATERNANKAGVKLRIYNADIKDFARKDAIVLTNPPYAKRLGEKRQTQNLYQDMGKALAETKRKFIITADEQFERYFGKRASKKRKLYNGSIRCTFYQYF